MLRPTPPLGWNSYDSYGASIKESEVVAQAQALKTTLQPFGWNQVVIDYRWYDPEDTLDASGRYLPSISKYPSSAGGNGLKTVADQVHALGLSFGIHIMRGIPRAAVTANSPIANSTFHAADAGNINDPCPWDTHMWGVNGATAAGQAWYDALFAQYAQWGIDFVKIDDMLNNTTKVYHLAEANAIRSAINKTGRAIVVSFSPGPDDPTWLPASVANLNANADMWRVVDDFWDYAAITNLAGVFTSAGTWQAAAGLAAGHWPDADMLPLGYLGPRCEWHATGETTFTHNDQVTIMSLWSILPSPLIFGGNVQSLTTDTMTGPWTTALLTNEEVLAVNQDALGTHAKRDRRAGHDRSLGARPQRRAQGSRALQPRHAGRDGRGHLRAARRHRDADRARSLESRRRYRNDDRALGQRPLHRRDDVRALAAIDRHRRRGRQLAGHRREYRRRGDGNGRQRIRRKRGWWGRRWRWNRRRPRGGRRACDRRRRRHHTDGRQLGCGRRARRDDLVRRKRMQLRHEWRELRQFTGVASPGCCSISATPPRSASAIGLIAIANRHARLSAKPAACYQPRVRRALTTRDVGGEPVGGSR